MVENFTIHTNSQVFISLLKLFSTKNIINKLFVEGLFSNENWLFVNLNMMLTNNDMASLHLQWLMHYNERLGSDSIYERFAWNKPLFLLLLFTFRCFYEESNTNIQASTKQTIRRLARHSVIKRLLG